MGSKRVSGVSWFKQRAFFLWVTFSMTLCAVLFLPWFLPRETVSGLMGRWSLRIYGTRRQVGRAVSRFLDGVIHPVVGTTETCVQIHRMERAARKLLYVEGETDGCE